MFSTESSHPKGLFSFHPLRACIALALAVCALGAAPPPTPPRAAAPVVAAPPSSIGSAVPQVTLPLAEYEKLVSKPAVTVVDVLRIGGSFAGRDLTVTFVGRASGVLPKIEALSGPSGVRLYGCDGDAILSRSGAGPFELTPLSAKFTLHCRVAITGSDRLQLDSSPSVLWVESAVTDGELVTYEESRDSSGRRSFSIVRSTGRAADEIRPIATARYRITLEPESTQFVYQFEVRNPNRAHYPFVVHLSGGELVQQVDTSASYELSGTDYKFQVPPGEVTVKLVGALKQAAFVPPISASVQYLLLESHPLLRPSLQTTAKRISATETGVQPRFRGAQGFLLADKDSLTWQVLKLEALRTTSFAVNEARHTFFLSSDGIALGESELTLDNQGAPALSLPMRAEPTFASIQKEPSFLTKSEQGELWVPLGQGAQDVLVQHRQPFERIAGLAIGKLYLPELKVPASVASVELRYGNEWVPLVESFAPELRIPILDGAELFLFVLLLGMTERTLNALRLKLRARLILSLLLGTAAMTSTYWLSLLCIADLLLLGLVVVPWLLSRKWGFWPTVGVLCLGGFLCLVVGSTVLLAPRASAPMSSPSYDRRAVSSGEEVPDWLSKENTKTAPPGGPGQANQPGQLGRETGAAAYQGLPAKFVMPYGSERSSYRREMLATDPARAVRVVMLARPTLGLVGGVLLLVGLVGLFFQRRQLRAGVIELWPRPRKSKPASG